MATFDPNDVEVVSGSKTFDPSEVEIVPDKEDETKRPAFAAGKGGGFDPVELASTGGQHWSLRSPTDISTEAINPNDVLRDKDSTKDNIALAMGVKNVRETAGALAGGEVGALAAGKVIPAATSFAGKIAGAAGEGAFVGAGSSVGSGETSPKEIGKSALVGSAGSAAMRGLGMGAVKIAEKLQPSASERIIDRAADAIEEGASKKARKGLQKDSDAANLREVLATKPELVKAVSTGKPSDQIIAAERVARDAGKRLRNIYRESEPVNAALNLEHGIDSNVVVANMKSRASKLANGDVVERKTAKALNDLAEEFNAAYSSQNVKAVKLRQEQSAYQMLGYAKTLDPNVQPAIEAAREASKAVGDSVVKHVTGMPYDEALAHAEANPDSVAGRLFQANKEVSIANKIKAAAESKIGNKEGSPHRLTHLIHGAVGTVMGGAAATAGAFHHGALALGLGAAGAAGAAAPYVLKALDGAVIRLAEKPLNPAIEKYAQRLVNMGIKANAVDSAIRRLNSEAAEYNAGP